MENLQTENILNLRDDIVISEAELRHIVTSEMIRVGLMPSLTGFRYFKEMVLISLQQKYDDIKTMRLYVRYPCRRARKKRSNACDKFVLHKQRICDTLQVFRIFFNRAPERGTSVDAYKRIHNFQSFRAKHG